MNLSKIRSYRICYNSTSFVINNKRCDVSLTMKLIINGNTLFNSTQLQLYERITFHVTRTVIFLIKITKTSCLQHLKTCY